MATCPRGSWEPALLRGTLLSPPQEALFVKLGRLGRRRLHVLTGRIVPFAVLGSGSGPLASQDDGGCGVGVCVQRKGLWDPSASAFYL